MEARVRDHAKDGRRLLGALAMAGLALFLLTLPTVGAGFSGQAATAGMFAADATFPPYAPTDVTAAAGCVTGSTVNYVASASGSDGSGIAADVSVAKPTGTAAGDLMLMAYYSVEATTLAPPAGWELLLVEQRLQIFFKVAGPSEPTSYAWIPDPSQRAVWAVSTYTGVEPTNPIEAFGAEANTGMTLVAPSVIPGVGDTRLVGFGGKSDRDDDLFNPTGMTALWGFDDGGKGLSNEGVQLGSATEPWPSAEPTGTREAGGTVSAPSVGALLALRPQRDLTDVTLSWTPTTTETAEGYRLERHTGGAFDEGWTASPWTETQLVDTTATEAKAYEYRIRTFEGIRESDPVSHSFTPTCDS